MNITLEKFEKFVGRSVKDPYDRFAGVIVGFYSDVDGTISSVGVEGPSGTFIKYPIEQFEFKGDNIVLIPTWKAEAEAVKKKLNVAKRRIAALEDLHARGEIASHAYEQFKKKLENDISRLKEELKEVKKKLNNKLAELSQQILELERISAALKVSYLSGEIGEKTYNHALSLIKRSLERCNNEKRDIDNELSELENLETAPVLPARKIESTPVPVKEEEKEEEEKPVEGEQQPIMVQILES